MGQVCSTEFMCKVSLGEEIELLSRRREPRRDLQRPRRRTYITSDAVGTSRLRRAGSHLLTVGWAGALSAVLCARIPADVGIARLCVSATALPDLRAREV